MERSTIQEILSNLPKRDFDENQSKSSYTSDDNDSDYYRVK